MEREVSAECSTKRGTPSRCITAVFVCFGIVLLYPLSTGPAMWCTERGFISERTIETIYSPLSNVTARIPFLYWLLDEYVVWWQ